MTGRSRAFGAALASALVVASAIASPAAVSPDIATRPSGDAPRDQSWRMTGRLTSAGDAFDFSASFFRFVKSPSLVLDSAAISVIDERTQALYQQRLTDREGSRSTATTGSFEVAIGPWRFRQTGSARLPVFEVIAKAGNLTLAVRGKPRKARVALEPALSGERNEAYTAMAASGTLTLDGKPLGVGGTAWLDHTASDDDAAREVPLAQARVQLDDGREIYIEERGAARRAYLIERDGSVDALARGSYYFKNHLATTWRSTHTGALYPDLWALGVSGKTPNLSLEPVAFDQEALGHGEGRTFWDGACDVYDQTEGSQGARLGSANVLLTGFQQKGASE